ncbi:MAG TPA: hypothetical protein VFE05_12685 [Longimicrobiaceae bacterium]|jgi:hypothetical protein|nr:hypothetical protein [Longimicrobiaceae bacterium]
MHQRTVTDDGEGLADEPVPESDPEHAPTPHSGEASRAEPNETEASGAGLGHEDPGGPSYVEFIQRKMRER